MRGETIDTHMGKPCEICGGVDFEYCIVTCSQCCSTHEHIYCMKKNLMEVPDVWVCEACTSNSNILSPICGAEKAFLDSFGVVHHEVMHPGTPGKVSTDPGWQANSTKPKGESGKVKFLPTEEAMRLSSGALKFGSPGRNNSGLKYGPSSSIGPMSRIISIPSKIANPKGVKPNSNVTSSAFMKPPSHDGAEINKMLGGHAVTASKESKEESCVKEWAGTISLPTKEDKTSKDKPKEVKTANANKEQKTYRAFTTSMQSVPFKEVETSNRKIEKAVNSTLTVSPITSAGITFHVVAEPENSAVEEQDYLIFQSKFELYRRYRPALEATWTGGFKFSDTAEVGSFYGGFLAQPPRIVHRKVFEFSKKLPKILQVKLLPRTHICADLFRKDCPDFHDIALYFFPSANIESSKHNNSCLFEILEIRDSVMRCCVDGVELLIFTSKHLHIDSQRVTARLDTKDFLWGVFHDAKTDHVLHESHEELPSLVSSMERVCDDHDTVDVVEATDMDIDMEGGRIAGPVDVVVSKELSMGACGSHDKGDVTEKMLLEPKHRRCTSSDLFTKSSEGIKHEISSEHPLSKGKLVNAKFEADCPPGFTKTPRLNSIEKKVQVVDGGVINHMKRENIGLQGLSGADFQASSQLQRSSEDSKLTKSLKRHQESGRDDGHKAYDPFAVFPYPLSEKVNQRGLIVKAEVNDDETPHRTWKKKQLEFEAERKMNISICWRPPKECVKLNIEGSSSRVMGSAGAGGIVRDESGKWILGYSKNLGTSQTSTSELWALYLGLKLVWERGFRKVQVESVSHEAVKCLEQPTAFLDPNRALIESCRELLNMNWDCKLQIIHREANLCANWLATHCEKQPLGALAVFDTPPYALIPIFRKDSAGIFQTHSH